MAAVDSRTRRCGVPSWYGFAATHCAHVNSSYSVIPDTVDGRVRAPEIGLHRLHWPDSFEANLGEHYSRVRIDQCDLLISLRCLEMFRSYRLGVSVSNDVV
jgi:hypothetical protein